MPSFADSWEFQELLNISKQHRDAVDPSRVRPDAVIGTDNWNTLRVSTVFAAISIEAGFNDFILSHCLFVETPYLQEFFGTVTDRFLMASVHDKLKLVVEHWPVGFPDELLRDVRKLFEIRNRVTHQKGRFQSGDETADNRSVLRNDPLSNDEMQHMLRHHEIAHDFLSRFWLPGTRELEQGTTLNPDARPSRMQVRE